MKLFLSKTIEVDINVINVHFLSGVMTFLPLNTHLRPRFARAADGYFAGRNIITPSKVNINPLFMTDTNYQIGVVIPQKDYNFPKYIG